MLTKYRHFFLRKAFPGPIAMFLFSMILGMSCSRLTKSDDQKSELPTELDSIVKAIMKEFDIPGISVVVLQGNKKLTSCYGHVDEGSAKLVNTNTLFSAQSISKTFTAIGVLKATEQGLVHLDTPITQYLPDFDVNSRYERQAQYRITLRHLLSHTSGLPADAPVGNTFCKTPNGKEYLPLKERIASLKEVWLMDSVGHRYHYSNVGFDLAAYVIEHQSGQPFSRFMKENVLDQIGMQTSTFQLDAVSTLPNRAIGHIYGVDEEIPVAFSSVGAGGLYTSAEDLGHFLTAATHSFHDMLDENNVHELVTTPGKTNNGYALGVVANSIEYCTPFYSHTGNGYGFTASMGWMPQHSIGFAILSNRESVYNGLVQIERAILKEFVPDNKNDRFCFKIGDLPCLVKPEDHNYYKSISGEYSNGSIALQFQFRDSLFGIIAPDDGAFHKIHFHSKNQWHFEDDSITYQFILRGEWLTNQNNGLTFKRVPMEKRPLGQLHTKWQSRAGRYRSYAYGVLPSVETIEWRNGALYFNDNVLKEHLPGLFFDDFGQVVDFRKNGVRIEYADYLKVD